MRFQKDNQIKDTLKYNKFLKKDDTYLKNQFVIYGFFNKNAHRIFHKDGTPKSESGVTHGVYQQKVTKETTKYLYVYHKTKNH